MYIRIHVDEEDLFEDKEQLQLFLNSELSAKREFILEKLEYTSILEDVCKEILRKL